MIAFGYSKVLGPSFGKEGGVSVSCTSWPFFLGGKLVGAPLCLYTLPTSGIPPPLRCHWRSRLILIYFQNEAAQTSLNPLLRVWERSKKILFFFRYPIR